jgi:hypothetical protein
LPYVIGYGGANLANASGMKTAFVGGQCVASQFIQTPFGTVLAGFKFNQMYFQIRLKQKCLRQKDILQIMLI